MKPKTSGLNIAMGLLIAIGAIVLVLFVCVWVPTQAILDLTSGHIDHKFWDIVVLVVIGNMQLTAAAYIARSKK